MSDQEQQRTWSHSMFKSLPGYPFDPCRICVGEGFKGMACDHTVLERAQAMHPGLVINNQARVAS